MIEQRTRAGHVQGRNGFWTNTAVVVWRGGNDGRNVYFDCKGKRNKVLNAGFSMDIESARALLPKLRSLLT